MSSHMKRYAGQGVGGSWAQKLLSAWSWGGPPFRHVDVCVHQLRSFLNLVLWGFLWRPWYVCMTDYTLFEAPLPFLENGAWGGKHLIQATDWKIQARLGLSGDQPPSWSPPRIVSLEKKHTAHPENSKGFRSSVSDAPITQEPGPTPNVSFGL